MLNVFLEFEYNQKLFTRKIQNINYWHLIRTEMYNDILRSKDDIPKAHQSKVNNSKIHLVLAKIKQMANLFIHNPFKSLEERDYLIFNHPRRVREDGNYKCLYTSDLTKELNGNYYMYEIPHNEKHFSPVLESEIKYTDIIINKYLLKRIFIRCSNQEVITEEEKKSIENLVYNINSKFKVDFSAEYWIKKIENKIIYYQIAYQSYSKIIDRIQPKVIIQVVSYLNSRFVINQIATEKGIPTIELQHGTMGKYHVAYNFLEQIEIPTFPDYLFVFGNYWKDNTRLPIDESRIISVGWPHYELQRNSVVEKNNKKQVVLFISQGTIGKELSEIACELNLLLNQDRYELIYKLHPGEYEVWRNNYPWLSNSNIQVIDNNHFDMTHYLRKADIQVGVNSTALFEGIGYALPTFIVELFGYQHMEDLYKNNYALLVREAEDVFKHLKDGGHNFGNIDTDYFWKRDSLENMIKEIDLIQKKYKNE